MYAHQKREKTHKSIESRSTKRGKKRRTASTCIACILSGPVPWTRNNATPSSLYVSSGISFSAM